MALRQQGEPVIKFTGARAFATEGARAALVTCEHCGAAILLDPTDKFDPMEQHRQWHRALTLLIYGKKPGPEQPPDPTPDHPRPRRWT